MDVRRLLIRSAIWTVLVLGLGMVGVWYIGTHPIPGVSNDARSRRLGEGAAPIALIGYAAIWLPACFRYGHERRNRTARKKSGRRAEQAGSKDSAMSRSTGWSPTLERALRMAAKGHEGQVRKGSPVPYVEHPMAVAMILDRAGFDEDVVIAGLLHDLVEDTDVSLDEIRASFGDDVAETVAACSEVKLDPTGRKRPWADRKRDHLETLKSATLATKAVILADKQHNLASIALDLEEGRHVWSTFNAPRPDVLAYYRASLTACGTGDPRLEVLARQASTILGRVEAGGESQGGSGLGPPAVLPGTPPGEQTRRGQHQDQ